MDNIGNKLLYLRKSKNIERCDAAEYFGMSEEELEQIELYKADYDIALLVKSCKLYNTSIQFLLTENEKAGVFKSPPEDYIRYEDTIRCVDNLKNFKKKDLNFIKKPDNCKGPSDDYFAWRILSSDFCLKGYVTMQDIKSMDYLYDGDIIVAIVLQKPVYGTFRMREKEIYINPINNPTKQLNLRAKGARIIGLVKHLDIVVS